MALAAMTDTDKSIYPIPKPNRLADRIHHCAKSTSTLQRQMRFEHDPKTFSALMKIIRKTAASYTDLTLPYKWQDQQTLDDIRDDVLEQCPTLEEMFVDAWPVYSYLQLAMKQHALGYGYKMVPGLRTSSDSKSVDSTSKRSTVTTEPERTPATFTPVATSSNPPEREPAGRELSWTSLVRRSTRVTNVNDSPNVATNASDNTYEGEEEEEVDELVDESDHISSSGSEKLADPTYEDPGHVSEDSSSDEESPLSQWPKGVPNFAYARNTLEQRVHDSEDGSYSPVGSVFYTPYQGRTPSTGPGVFDNSTTSTTGRTDITAPEHIQPTDAPVPVTVHPPIVAQTSTSRSSSSVIENMLLARGLPLADAERIALLFASLGIMDETYLRVFAHLAASRKAWLTATRERGELSEIQAWVVVDMLDAVMGD